MNKISRNILLLFMAVLILCMSTCTKKRLTKTIDFDLFTLEVPDDWERTYPNFTDGYYGEITNGKDVIAFDYGVLSFSSLDSIEPNDQTCLFEELHVNGAQAKLVARNYSHGRLFALYLQKDEDDLNVLYGKDLKNERLAERIFKSHRFK